MLLPLDIVLCTRAFAGAPQNPSGASHFCGQQLNCALHQERWRADHAATAGYCSGHEGICWSATESFRSKSLLRPAAELKNAGGLIVLLPLDIVLCTRAFAGAPQNPSGASHFCGQQLNCALHQERWRADRAATAGYCSVHEGICWSATESFRSKSLLRNFALHQERWRADRAATAGYCSVHEAICWSATESFRSRSLLRRAAELRFEPRTLAS